MSVMQIASGIGPVKKETNRKLTEKVINKSVDIITLREEKSLRELKNMNITVPVELTADPAVSLEGESTERISEIFAKSNIPFEDYICVAVREWKKATPHFESHMAKAMDYIFEKYKKNIVFVPMQYPTDLGISQKISKKMKNKSYVIDKETTISEVIGIIGHSSLVVAMRLHSLVYAVSCGVGVIALKYDPKIDGFMEYFRQAYIADVTTVTEEELKNLADRYFANEENGESETLCCEMKEKAKRNAILAVEQLKKQ
jgi:polysaccharide pyruvyl transferase WcaK-like protein